MYEHQKYQHSREAELIKRIADYCAKNNIPFKDLTGTEDDYKYGVDCYIGDRPFDLKCSDSRKLTVIKRLPNGIEYKPYEKHTRIPYLYCLPSSGKCYIITKQTFKSFIEYYKSMDMLDDIMTIYTGDGNTNYCINISRLLNNTNLFVTL